MADYLPCYFWVVYGEGAIKMTEGELLGWVRSFLTDLGVWSTLGTALAVVIVVATGTFVMRMLGKS